VAIPIIGGNGQVADVAIQYDSLLISGVPVGEGYTVEAETGLIAAALAANSTVFAMRLDPGTTRHAWINEVWLRWLTTTAFTAPILRGRRLALYRGSGAAASGGTGIAAAALKQSDHAASEFNAAGGGDIRIATTGALTVAGITYESVAIGRPFIVEQIGALNGNKEELIRFEHDDGPVVLRPGELLAVRNPVAMDAAGVWTLWVGVKWREFIPTAD
jgi:hypothetical protein